MVPRVMLSLPVQTAPGASCEYASAAGAVLNLPGRG